MENLLLNSGADGRAILANKLKLRGDLRQKLVNIAVNELVNDLLSQDKDVEYVYFFLHIYNNFYKNIYFSIKAGTFKKLAKEISSLFPGESEEVYFIPYSSGKGTLRKQPARGKLWSRYINLKAQIRLLNRDSNKSSNNTCSNIDNTECDVENITYECAKSFDFITKNVAPFPKVLQNWEETFDYRNKKYSHSSIEEIFKTFPPLKTDYALLLVSSVKLYRS